MNVGVRELRDSLRACLAAARGGDEVVITEHGHPIARIVPISGATGIERLVDAGVISRPTEPPTSARGAKRVNAKGSVSDLVKDQRR